MVHWLALSLVYAPRNYVTPPPVTDSREKSQILKRFFFFFFFFSSFALISDLHSFPKEPATDANSSTGALGNLEE